MGKKAILDLTPEQRAAEAERARLLRQFGEKHGLAEAQKRVRLFAEKHGIPQLRKPEPPPPTPQEPTPAQPKRGRKRSLTPEQIKEGIRILRDKPKMSVKAARQTLREAGIDGEDGPLYRLIIRPAYRGMSK